MARCAGVTAGAEHPRAARTSATPQTFGHFRQISRKIHRSWTYIILAALLIVLTIWYRNKESPNRLAVKDPIGAVGSREDSFRQAARSLPQPIELNTGKNPSLNDLSESFRERDERFMFGLLRLWQEREGKNELNITNQQLDELSKTLIDCLNVNASRLSRRAVVTTHELGVSIDIPPNLTDAKEFYLATKGVIAERFGEDLSNQLFSEYAELMFDLFNGFGFGDLHFEYRFSTVKAMSWDYSSSLTFPEQDRVKAIVGNPKDLNLLYSGNLSPATTLEHTIDSPKGIILRPFSKQLDSALIR